MPETGWYYAYCLCSRVKEREEKTDNDDESDDSDDDDDEDPAKKPELSAAPVPHPLGAVNRIRVCVISCIYVVLCL